MMIRVILVFAVFVLVDCYPSGRSGVVTDPVFVSEFFDGEGVVRTKREGVAGGWRRRRDGGDNAYRSVGKLDSRHPFRRKVRPVEKPITPYFVRVLRRRPVGPSAMNYTSSNVTFESSDNGEVIDVPRVLVDKRRNKNVDIHPIYVVEDDEKPASGEIDYSSSPAGNESLVFVPTSTEPRSTTTSTPFTFGTTSEPSTGLLEISEVTKGRELATQLSTEGKAVGRVPVVTFTRVEGKESGGGEEYYSDYKGRGNGSEQVDYLPLEYDYEKVDGELEGEEGRKGSEKVEVVSGGALRLISLRGEPDEEETVSTPAPPVVRNSQKSIYETVDNHHVAVASRKRVLQRNEGPVDVREEGELSAGSAVYADYGYGGVVIGGDKSEGTTEGVTEGSTTFFPSTSRPSTTTTTTTARPTTTTTTTTTTTPRPTTTPTTTTTTTTTTPRPTTTTTTTTTTPPPTTTTTTTTPPPTTSTTTSTTTTTTPPPTTTTTTTPPPTTTLPPTTQPTQPTPQLSEQQFLTELLNSLPEDDQQSSLSPQDASTLQQLLLAHILSSTPIPPIQDPIPSYTHPHQVYTNPPDLQTSASTTTALFSTRADVNQELPRTTTTKNPLFALFDSITGNSNQQRSTAAIPQQQPQHQPQQQVVSIVRPIQEEKNSDAGNFMRMLIQLPGNMLTGLVRAMQAISQMGVQIISGFVRFMSGLGGGGGNAGGSGGGLFGG